MYCVHMHVACTYIYHHFIWQNSTKQKRKNWKHGAFAKNKKQTNRMNRNKFWGYRKTFGACRWFFFCCIVAVANVDRECVRSIHCTCIWLYILCFEITTLCNPNSLTCIYTQNDCFALPIYCCSWHIVCRILHTHTHEVTWTETTEPSSSNNKK